MVIVYSFVLRYIIVFCVTCPPFFLVVFSTFWALLTIKKKEEEMELRGFRILVVGDLEDKICCLMLEDNF